MVCDSNYCKGDTGYACTSASDCGSSYCVNIGSGFVCTATQGALNNGCTGDRDCLSGFCSSGYLCSDKSNGMWCQYTTECSSGFCSKDVPVQCTDGSAGQPCDPNMTQADQCSSGYCGTDYICDGAGKTCSTSADCAGQDPHCVNSICSSSQGGVNDSCVTPGDCSTNYCSYKGDGYTYPPFKCTDGSFNQFCDQSKSASDQCSSGFCSDVSKCSDKSNGMDCMLTTDCTSGFCAGGPAVMTKNCTSGSAGEVCNPSGNVSEQCSSGYCGTDNVCDGAGKSCSSEGDCAGQDQYCVNYVCSSNQGSAVFPADQCTTGGDCLSGFCTQNGWCSDKSSGSHCLSSSDCTDGFCEQLDNQCTNGGPGQRCFTGDDCLYNNCSNSACGGSSATCSNISQCSSFGTQLYCVNTGSGFTCTDNQGALNNGCTDPQDCNSGQALTCDTNTNTCKGNTSYACTSYTNCAAANSHCVNGACSASTGAVGDGCTGDSDCSMGTHCGGDNKCDSDNPGSGSYIKFNGNIKIGGKVKVK